MDAAEVRGHAIAVERRRHDDEPAPLAVQEQREQQVDVERPLVELVEDDGVGGAHQRVVA
jgi:hypothetical protein